MGAHFTSLGIDAVFRGTNSAAKYVSIVDPVRGQRRVRQWRSIRTPLGRLRVPTRRTRLVPVRLGLNDAAPLWQWQERSRRVPITWARGRRIGEAHVAQPLTGGDFGRVVYPGEWLVFWDRETGGVPLFFMEPHIPLWGDEVPDPDSIQFAVGSIQVSMT